MSVEAGNGVVGWIVLLMAFVFGVSADLKQAAQTYPDSVVETVIGDGADLAAESAAPIQGITHTQVAAWITVVGGSIIGLIVIGYDRIGRVRIAVIKATDEANHDSLTGKVETANETIHELEAELTKSVAARDADNMRSAAEIKRLTEEADRLFRLIEQRLLATSPSALPTPPEPTSEPATPPGPPV